MVVIHVEALSCSRRTGAPPVLREISINVAAGEIVCLLGPNGAGKSTLLQCLLGLVPGWTGSALIAGQPVRAMTRRALARLVAYVPQATAAAFPFTVEQMVMMGRSAHFGFAASPAQDDRRLVDEALAAAGISHLRRRIFGELSGGEQQLVLVTRALAQQAPVIVLDEPAASLDLGNQARVLRLVRDLAEGGRAVLMTTHIPSHLFTLKATAALLRQGRIVATGPADEICTELAMSELYGTPLDKLGKAGSESAAFVPAATCEKIVYFR